VRAAFKLLKTQCKAFCAVSLLVVFAFSMAACDSGFGGGGGNTSGGGTGDNTGNVNDEDIFVLDISEDTD
jgi:hypothetical protein